MYPLGGACVFYAIACCPETKVLLIGCHLVIYKVLNVMRLKITSKIDGSW